MEQAKEHRPNAQRTLVYGFLGILPWVVWYAAILYMRAVVRTLKGPNLYTGTCYKLNGYAVTCSLDQWLLWDAAPYIDIFTFIGGLLAATVTGFVYLKYLSTGVGR